MTTTNINTYKMVLLVVEQPLTHWVQHPNSHMLFILGHSHTGYNISTATCYLYWATHTLGTTAQQPHVIYMPLTHWVQHPNSHMLFILGHSHTGYNISIATCYLYWGHSHTGYNISTATCYLYWATHTLGTTSQQPHVIYIGATHTLGTTSQQPHVIYIGPLTHYDVSKAIPIPMLWMLTPLGRMFFFFARQFLYIEQVT